MIPYPEVLSRIPFERLHALDESSVRFAYPRPREVPQHWDVVLDKHPDIDEIEPDRPNREAIANLVGGLRHALIESFEQGQGCALFATAGIDDPRGWRDVLLDLYCRPRWVYTNTQRTFALLELPGERFRVAELPSLGSLHEFRTLYVRSLPKAHDVVDFGHFDAAEVHILRALSSVEMRALPLRNAEGRRTLLLQTAGSRPGPRGHAISLYVAHLGGESSLVEVEPERCDAYTVLNRLREWIGKRLGDDVVEACATCSGFRFSGMARDHSSGTRGYCRRRLELARKSDRPMSGMDARPSFGTVVSVFDRCGAYEAIADEEREVEFCQHGGKPGDED